MNNVCCKAGSINCIRPSPKDFQEYALQSIYCLKDLIGRVLPGMKASSKRPCAMYGLKACVPIVSTTTQRRMCLTLFIIISLHSLGGTVYGSHSKEAGSNVHMRKFCD